MIPGYQIGGMSQEESDEAQGWLRYNKYRNQPNAAALFEPGGRFYEETKRLFPHFYNEEGRLAHEFGKAPRYTPMEVESPRSSYMDDLYANILPAEEAWEAEGRGTGARLGAPEPHMGGDVPIELQGSSGGVIGPGGPQQADPDSIAGYLAGYPIPTNSIPTTGGAIDPGGPQADLEVSPEESDLLALAASHASPDNNVDELIKMRRAGMRGDSEGLTEAQFRQGMNSILYGPSMKAASDARYEAVMEPRREALQEPSPADSPVPIYDPTFDEGAAEYAPSPVRTYDPTFDEGAATREVEEALEEAAPETYRHWMASQHPGVGGEWYTDPRTGEDSQVKDWQIADAKSVAAALANIREPEEPRIEEVVEAAIAEERIPGSAPGYRPGGGGLGSQLSREDLATISMGDWPLPPYGTPGFSETVDRRLRAQRGRAMGGIVGLEGGGYVPVYANGGFIPGYGLGGFFKGLAKGVLKVAPVAAMFIPGVGPLASAGIGAVSGALGKKLEGGSWGDAAKSGLMKGIMSGVGRYGVQKAHGAMMDKTPFHDMPGEGGFGGFLGKIGKGAEGLAGVLNKPGVQALMPMVGELGNQLAGSGGGGGDAAGMSIQHAKLPGPRVMPQSAGTGTAQGYAAMPNTTVGRAMGGIIPGYQFGGEFGGMVGDEPMGGYIPQQPGPQPVAQQIQQFIPRTLPKGIQKKISEGKKLTKKENQRVRKLPKEDQQNVRKIITERREAPAQAGVPQAQVDPSMVPEWGDLQLDPRMNPPVTDRGSAGQPPGGYVGPGGDMGGEGGPDMGGVMEELPATQAGMPPGGYVGPGGQGGGDMGGEGGPDMGGGLAGGYVPPGGRMGGPDMGGVREALPATGYNPLTGQGYVPPGGVPQEPEPLPQGAGLADTSGGVKPTDWLKAEFKKQNPDSEFTDADIIRWAAKTGTPNTEGGWEGGLQAGVGPDSDASAPPPDPNLQFGGELPGDPGGEPEDGGDEGFPGGEEERHAIPGRPPPGADRRSTPPPEQQWQPPQRAQPAWQPPERAKTGQQLPDITEGASTVSTPEGYRPGFMKEGQMSDIIGHDPFNMPTQASDFADPRTQDMMNRLSAPAAPTQNYLQAAPTGKAEGGMIPSEEIDIVQIVQTALQSPDEPWAQEILQRIQSEYPELLEQLMGGGRTTAGPGEMATEGFIPPFEGSMNDGSVDDRLAVTKESLARGGPYEPAAALAPNEYIVRASAMDALVPGQGPEAGAQIMDNLVEDIERKGRTADRPLDIRVS